MYFLMASGLIYDGQNENKIELNKRRIYHVSKNEQKVCTRLLG
jgi:hypothetical protein